MTDGFTHIRENNEDTQQHLDENREKFEADWMYLYRLMQMGKRLTTQGVRDMKIDDRRLREIFEEGKCKKEWMFRELPNGKKKRTHVEYFCEISKPMTKGKLIELFTQQNLFP